ncbi:MAG: DNA methyltransferase [Blautia sp.]
MWTPENDIVLDFFSGSGTTAEAVMRSNLEGGKTSLFLCNW